MGLLRAAPWALSLALALTAARADDAPKPETSPAAAATPNPAASASPATATPTPAASATPAAAPTPAASASPAAATPTPAASASPITAAPAPSAAATIPTSLDIRVSVGDSWVYDVRDDITGDARATVEFAVTRIADGDIETRVIQSKSSTGGRSTGIEIFDSRWRMKDNGKVVFKPYSGLLGAPQELQVGKSWPIAFHAIRVGAPGGQDVKGAAKLEAWERLTLPNGAAYDAFKTDFTSSVTLPNGRKRESHSIQWFAPAVNRVVKRIDENRVNGKLLDATEQTLRSYKPATKS